MQGEAISTITVEEEMSRTTELGQTEEGGKDGKLKHNKEY